jgi:MtN3 and saliva related transmembrane protein
VNPTTMLAVAAASCGIAMGLSPLLQLRRVAIRRSSADVSIAYLAVLLVGFTLWLSYGIALHDAPLIVSNVVALATNVVTIATVLRFRRAA